MKHKYNKKKYNQMLDKLLDKTIDGNIKWERIGRNYYWSYKTKMTNGWKWDTSKGSIHMGNLNKDVISFVVFNNDNMIIIDNKYDILDTEHPVVQIYNHVQDEYDKMGAELLDKLLKDLNEM